MVNRDPDKPLFGQINAFEYQCECGHAGVVDERTDRSVFDPTTGRFTCPECLETRLLLLTVSPESSEPDPEM